MPQRAPSRVFGLPWDSEAQRWPRDGSTGPSEGSRRAPRLPQRPLRATLRAALRGPQEPPQTLESKALSSNTCHTFPTTATLKAPIVPKRSPRKPQHDLSRIRKRGVCPAEGAASSASPRRGAPSRAAVTFFCAPPRRRLGITIPSGTNICGKRSSRCTPRATGRPLTATSISSRKQARPSIPSS